MGERAEVTKAAEDLASTTRSSSPVQRHGVQQGDQAPAKAEAAQGWGERALSTRARQGRDKTKDKSLHR
jgi:hypothetical protein